MTRPERARIVQEHLQRLYPEPPIPLVHHDAYSLLVAVLLSAQCTDARVNQVTPRLWQLARTPLEMAAQPHAAVLEIVRPCGLGPRKAAAIVELSAILVREHNGQVPRSLEALERLPGVGHKTAQVVVAQAFGEPAFPVDTHIHRLAGRWRLSRARNVVETERDLKAIFPREAWNRLHLQIIYYGREYCSARGCDGRTCPLCRLMSP